jgi:glucose/arabinose dehydrogenase
MRRVALCLVLLAACADGAEDTTASSTTTTTAAATTTGALPPVEGIKAVEVGRVDQPTAMAVRRGDNAIYIAEKTGRVRRLADGAVVVDVSGNLSLAYEQGLLGLAFSPDGRYLYIDYTDRAGDTRIAEKDMEQPSSPLRELLLVDQPFANHNGGQLAFGPDGRLYIAMGDGGSGNDPNGNAQNLNTLLGKILRIDPRPSGDRPYGIPPDNPFVGQSGRRAEIWAFGLRNPWRFSFDREKGDMWIADVGQGAIEEIDLDEAPLEGGRNYEWVLREGTRRRRGDKPPNGVQPVHEYDHNRGECSVTGGYAYRGKALRGFEGAYFFADFCLGELMGLRNGKAESLGLTIKQVSSFGEDAAGELYALSLDGPVYRLEPK